ncbi:MAG TPA: alanine--glyoxylate aminotransferase family protein [Bacteroidales bacterium]|nr:alanine--glyoxylate aminotransferase family protein [Bacteroidales bacterium]
MKNLLMIPGPIEFNPEVLTEMGKQTLSHVSGEFIDIFAASLEMMKQVWQCPDGQAFIMAGSGTLAMDMAGANLVETNDGILVISTGYFGERYAELLARYGADCHIISARPGETVPAEIIEDELKKGKYKMLTFTHVDTSTAVRVDPEPLGQLGRKYGVLTVLDGVCSVAGEEIKQQEWGIDIVLTASQKAVGVPPGLALLVASQKAMDAFHKRKSPVMNYYADWTHWLPVMKAYEEHRPAYFGTPAVNLVSALNISLKQILSEGLEKRFIRHGLTASAIRSGLKTLGLKQIPSDNIAANTLSAPYYPEGVKAAEFIGEMKKAGVIVAGGLLPELRNKYFRIGHMGKITTEEAIAVIQALEAALDKLNYNFDKGSGVKVAKDVLESLS